MNIYFLDGKHIILNISDIKTDIISNKKCIMKPILTKYIQQQFDNKYYYSFFIKDKDIELEYYIPINISNIFALESIKNPYLLHNIVKFKNKNDITLQLIKYMKDDLNIYNKDGYIPLYIACIHQNIDIVKQLVYNGSNYHIQCNGYLSSYDYCNTAKVVNSIYDEMFNFFCIIDGSL